MNLTAEALLIMAAKGLSLEDVAEIVKANEMPEERRSAAAKRQARYRQRQRESVTSDVTGDVTVPPKENKSNPPRSVSNETGFADPVKELFDVGVALLTSAGTNEKQARSLVGKWRKAKGDGPVLQAFIDCRTKAISNPVEWLEKRLASSKYVSASGYEYRGTAEQVLREAEKRNDMNTYWRVKAELGREKAA